MHSGVAVRYLADGDYPMPWFHGNITRERTEKLLANRSDGTFLVRDSTNFPGDYTLCMAYKGKVEHYRIYHQTNGRLTCDHEENFENLTELVKHYKRDADGLCCRLATPIIEDKYCISRDPLSIEERMRVFRQASLVIHRSEIRLGDIIGHGEFGDVLSGDYNGRCVAVKVLKRNGMVQSLLDEAKVKTNEMPLLLFLVGLNHKNLVSLVGVVLDDPSDVFMVTEYLANGNLVDFLRSRGRHQVEKLQLTQFAIDICQGMGYLEAKNVVHRDLAARNILLDAVLTAKISDFGLAKNAADCYFAESTTGKFPIKWTAPEALRNSRFSTKSDMWSFGILLWEIFSFGRVPYPRIPIQDVIRHIEKGYRMESPESCPTGITRLMTDAWSLEPEDRPSFSEALQRLNLVHNNIISGTVGTLN
uniref:Tyrosine-protein kinase n=1 Tax=Syphacia muris TaxID=451379 RepID=A0A0N5A9U1_9BILA